MKGGAAEGEEDDEKDKNDDVDMKDAEGGPKETWDKFRAGDEVDDDGGEVKASPGKKRARDRAEPATSAVMAHEAMQSLLDAWEEESDKEGGGGSSRKGKRKRGELAASTWIHEDSNVPLDFMSADAAHSVLTVRPSEPKRRRGEAEGPAGAENRADALRRHGLRFAEDGRLVVDDTVEKKEEDDDEDGDGKVQSGARFNHGVVGKTLKPLSQLAALRAKRAQAKAKARLERRGGHLVKGLDNYKPGKKKGAAGDAKRGNDLNPFAYVRLNPKVIKEKFRSKATESFSKVIKGAKKGILKGHKAKAREAKHKHIKQAQKRRRGKARPTNLR